MTSPNTSLIERINNIDSYVRYGRILGERGLMIELVDPVSQMDLGRHIVIERPEGGAFFAKLSAFMKIALLP